jgi:hypothetical protein
MFARGIFMTTSELLQLLQHGYDGDPWHGPSLKAVLDRVPAATAAAARPLPGRHSIWELVLHLTAWTREVERRLDGSAPDVPAEGDWPAPPGEPTQAAHRALESTVARVPSSRWDEIIGTPRDPALGTGYSYGFMVAGLAAHYAYHSGQIALLAQPAR